MNRLCLVVIMLLLQACGEPQSAPHFVQPELDVWVPYGNENERRMVQQQVAHYNAMQDMVRINAVILPAGVYHDQIDMAAANGRLPDIFEMDSRYVAYHAWRKHLQPIDKLMTDSVRNDLLPSLITQNMVQGRLYAVSLDSRLALLYARRSMLERAGIVTPAAMTITWSTLAQWVEQLDSKVSAAPDHPALIELNGRDGEAWLAERLLLRSHAGDLSAVDDMVAGLATPATVQWLVQVQGWLTGAAIDRQDDDAFLAGQVPLALATQEEFDLYAQRWQDDLLVLPLMGDGPGLQANLSWGLSPDCRDSRLAMRFIEFLLQPQQVLMMADASVALPATHSALLMSDHFRIADAAVFDVAMLERESTQRLASPAYPQIQHRLADLMQVLASGGDVLTEAQRASVDMRLIMEQYRE